MAPKKSLLGKMKENPLGDWTIADVERLVAAETDMDLRRPNGSSHYVVVSSVLRDRLCVPHNRPIKPKYIRLLVSYVESHRKACERKGGGE